MHEEGGKQKFRDKFEEGKTIKDQLNKEKRDLERIKEEKLNELNKLNIPSKYRVDLKKFKL